MLDYNIIYAENVDGIMAQNIGTQFFQEDGKGLAKNKNKNKTQVYRKPLMREQDATSEYFGKKEEFISCCSKIRKGDLDE